MYFLMDSEEKNKKIRQVYMGRSLKQLKDHAKIKGHQYLYIEEYADSAILSQNYYEPVLDKMKSVEDHQRIFKREQSKSIRTYLIEINKLKTENKELKTKLKQIEKITKG